MSASNIHMGRQLALYTAFAERATQQRRSEIARLQEHMSTGKQINRASDDPTAFAQARRMETLTRQYDQFDRSISTARLWVADSAQALAEMEDSFVEAYEKGIQMANGTWDEGDREISARRMEQLLQNVVDSLNTQSGDEYVFAGNQTTTEPFRYDGAVLQYDGGNGARNRYIGRDTSVAINLTGREVVETGRGFDIVEAMQDMIDAVRSGVPADLESALGNLEIARDHVIDQSAEVGNIMDRLDMAASQVRDARLTVEQRRSELEDTDFAQTITDFQREQTGLQAALQVTSTALKTTLLDYLR